MKNPLSSSVLKKIKKDNIEPLPKWYFFIRNTLLAGLVGLFTLFGILACAIIFHFFNNFAFLEFLLEGPRVFMKVLWIGIPFLWIFLMAVFCIFAGFTLQRTKKGYKIPVVLAFASILLVQIASGALLEQSNVGERLDRRAAQHMKFYQHAQARREGLWTKPDEGFLAGTIVEVQADKILLLNDLQKKRWEVDYEESRVGPRVELSPEEKIRVRGEKIADDKFKAKRIGVWDRKRRPGRGGPRKGAEGWPPRGEDFEKRRAEREKRIKEKFEITEVLDQKCERHFECETPANYMIQSNCPYTTRCLENKCTVVCPKF